MKKRFNLTWRIMVALVLVLSLVPTLIATTGGVALAAAPTVWLDPIPAYVGALSVPAAFSGTALATAPRSVMDILIQIKFKDSVTNTWLYWDGAAGDWTTVSDSYNYANTLTTPGIWGTQTDWRWNGGAHSLPIAGDLTNGITYTVTAWAMDDNLDKSSSVSRTFIYDSTLPSGSAIQVIGDATLAGGWIATSITTISGISKDTTPGAVGQVQIELQDTTTGDYWDGSIWVAPATPILATGTTSWSVTTSTNPALPNWISGHGYTVTLYVWDKAGNAEAVAPTQNFVYNKIPASGLNIAIDTLPSYMQTANFVQVTGSSKASGTLNTILDGWVKIYNNAARFWNDVTPAWEVGDPDIWNQAFPQDLAFDEQIEPWTYDNVNTPPPNWPTLTDGMTYTITARVEESTLAKKDSSSQNVVMDDTLPINTAITQMGITTYLAGGPTVFEGSTYEDLVQGSSTDNTGGVASGKLGNVRITITDITAGTSWTGLAWGAATNLYASPKDGSFNSNGEGWKLTDTTTPALPYWMHNHQYIITALAIDAAGNAEAAPATLTFWYVKDLSGTAPLPTPTPTTPPTPTAAPALACAVTNPTNNANISELAAINGTSADDVAVLGLKVRILNVSSGLYWNGAAWVATLALADAPAATASDGAFNSVSEPWFYTTLPTWGTGSTYQVQAQASDATTTTADSSVVAFGIGTTPPVTPTPTPVTPTPTPVTPTPTPVTPTATPVTPTPTPGTSGSATIPTTGGTVATGDGKVEVTFPSGAFTSSTAVTIASASCHGDTDAFIVGSTCFSVTASDEELGAEATICVDLSSYDLSLGDEGDLTLGYWSDGEWHAISSEINGNTICGTTNHLSDWAVLSSTGEGWLWWYWALIGGGAFIVVLAIILLLVLPKRGKGEEIPSEELYGEEEEEF